MKLYLVYEETVGNWGEHQETFRGVFSSEEKAKEFISKQNVPKDYSIEMEFLDSPWDWNRKEQQA